MSRPVKILCLVLLVLSVPIAYGVYIYKVKQAEAIVGPPKVASKDFYDPAKLAKAQEAMKQLQRMRELKALVESDPAKAVAPLKELVAEQPENSEAWLQLAIALRRSGQEDACRQTLEDAVTRDWKDPRAADRARLLLVGLLAPCSVDSELRSPTAEDKRAIALLNDVTRSDHLTCGSARRSSSASSRSSTGSSARPSSSSARSRRIPTVALWR